jgi:hypothetical protein
MRTLPTIIYTGMPIPVAAGSNSAEGTDVCLLCLYDVLSCVGRGLCDGMITSPEESYLASNCVRLRKLNTEEDKGHRKKNSTLVCT